MKHQALFPHTDKTKKIKCCLLQFLFGALRVKLPYSRLLVSGRYDTRKKNSAEGYVMGRTMCQ